MIRRGLSLLEVVLATTLLAAIVAALLPLLRDAHRTAEPDTRPNRVFDLAWAADDALDPDAADPLDLDLLAAAASQGQALHHADLRITATVVDTGARRWAWIAFERDGLAVARWIELEAQP